MEPPEKKGAAHAAPLRFILRQKLAVFLSR